MGGPQGRSGRLWKISNVIRSPAVVFVYFVYFLVSANSFISGTGGFIVHNRILNYVHEYESILSVLEDELITLCAVLAD